MEHESGDQLSFVPKVYKVKVITLCDRASRGEYKDLSGPEVAKQTGDFSAHWPGKYRWIRKSFRRI